MGRRGWSARHPGCSDGLPALVRMQRLSACCMQAGLGLLLAASELRKGVAGAVQVSHAVGWDLKGSGVEKGPEAPLPRDPNPIPGVCSQATPLQRSEGLAPAEGQAGRKGSAGGQVGR